MNAMERLAALRSKHETTLAANAAALSNFEKLAQGMKQPKTDRERVTDFLATLEFDSEDTEFELEQCSKNPEARKYWLARASGELL